MTHMKLDNERVRSMHLHVPITFTASYQMVSDTILILCNKRSKLSTTLNLEMKEKSFLHEDRQVNDRLNKSVPLGKKLVNNKP